ncbi:IQ domain-containing protein IQM2-like [Andrographis paniculata]|uniref:IQ domain-containing protein IQM2-like n=1 Tax=Andrographis paniculata TaxID=175694 RepID=UPI0021E838BA|nr:IQ domain-containing protein IQM2-like [Andrographis paniculata]
MGVSFSCPLSICFDLENGFESIKQGDVEEHSAVVRSTSFKGKDTEPLTPNSLCHEKFWGEGSIRCRTRRTAGRIAEFPGDDKFRHQESPVLLSRSGSSAAMAVHSPVLDQCSPKHEAAIKLQKVYKSFRTRRKLADCAVLIEQSWWKLLDFAELKHSSISFFDIEKHETAISRWSRARTRAAKVGKGLSKNSKAQKLALQHWLEAIDPRHRYGHNLHFYYMNWLDSQSKEPFFYWLDIGEGKEVNIVEKCPRPKLQQQCIKYLGPMERKAYEVGVEDGKLFYKRTGQLLDTPDEPKGSKWIFVLSTSRALYVGKKNKGLFQHSSFLAGGATMAAGRIVAENGVLKAVWPHSGHYRPTPENFQDFISFLRDNSVDITHVKFESNDDEEEKSVGKHLRSNSSEDDSNLKNHAETEENDTEDSSSKKVYSREETIAARIEIPTKLRTPYTFSNLTALQLPSKDDLLERLKSEKEQSELTEQNMSEEQHEDSYETISEDSILQRINSHKGMKSYQLGKQLSCKWSTGAGPRIGCLRDYPSRLQSHALEQVNLSPRSKHRLKLDSPARASTPSGSNLSGQSSLVNKRTKSSF